MPDTAPAINGGFSWERTSVWDIGSAPFLLRVAHATEATLGGGYATGRRLSATDLDVLVPHGFTVLADFRPRDTRILTVEDDTRVAMLTADDDTGRIAVEVYSRDGYADARTVADAILGLAAPTVAPEEGLQITYWVLGPFGASAYRRHLDAADWTDTAGNYAAGLRSDLDRMHAWAAFPAGGRLILVAGAPGTGKTTLVKSLARAWRPWCDVQYVVDPDQFFGDANYMTGVLIGQEDEERARLIVVEDCDELLAVDAKRQSGEGFSRLLNVCDGLVGQGLNLALYLTTNEPVETFHPAILRPGRCLATLHVDPLDADAADAWRTAHDLPTTGEAATLAELYGEDRKHAEIRARQASDEFALRIRTLTDRARTLAV